MLHSKQLKTDLIIQKLTFFQTLDFVALPSEQFLDQDQISITEAQTTCLLRPFKYRIENSRFFFSFLMLLWVVFSRRRSL